MSSFITRAQQLSWGTGSGNTSIFGGGTGNADFLTNSDFPPGCDWNPLPGALTLERMAVRTSAAPGTNFTFQPFKGIPQTPTGPSIVLLSGNQDVEGSVAVTVNAPLVAGDLATEAFGWVGSSAGGSINGRSIFQYSVASPYDKYNVIASGFGGSNFFTSANRYVAMGSSLSSTVQANVQTCFPLTGTFKYLLVVVETQDTSGDSTYNCSLQVNGLSVLSVSAFTNSASPVIATNTSGSAGVSQGDKVNFIVTTTITDIGHRGRVYLAVGFLPA